MRYVADEGGEFLLAFFLLLLPDEFTLFEKTFLAFFGVLLLLLLFFASLLFLLAHDVDFLLQLALLHLELLDGTVWLGSAQHQWWQRAQKSVLLFGFFLGLDDALLFFLLELQLAELDGFLELLLLLSLFLDSQGHGDGFFDFESLKFLSVDSQLGLMLGLF